MTKIVQLRAAKIPGVIGLIAVHYWFVIVREQQCDRWEIWQRANRGKICWGHLHKNLMAHDRGVGNGESWIEAQWSDRQADWLIDIIEKSPQHYPFNDRYRYYPGPNSNTYVQWVFNQGKMNYLLGRKGIGKNYWMLFPNYQKPSV